MIKRWMYLFTLVALVVSCEDREKQAVYDMGLVRDLEESAGDIREAIEGYQRVAEAHDGTPSGHRARVRAEQLASAEGKIARLTTATGDSVYTLGSEILGLAPSYPPAMRSVAVHLHQKASLWGRAAATRNDQIMLERVMASWGFQDSIWSQYDFRPIPEDRNVKNLLCDHAVEVARMLEEFRRYKEALQIVNRGIEYGESNDALAKAKVFASFYHFRGGSFDSAVVVAKEALTNDHLNGNLKARANHVVGLGYTYMYQDSNSAEHLDAAISALNLAIGLDPSMSDVRKLLKELRKKKATIPS
jgi:tetratricopeptide (TPR) repeat protein